jgi:hypothetical protein
VSYLSTGAKVSTRLPGIWTVSRIRFSAGYVSPGQALHRPFVFGIVHVALLHIDAPLKVEAVRNVLHAQGPELALGVGQNIFHFGKLGQYLGVGR